MLSLEPNLFGARESLDTKSVPVEARELQRVPASWNTRIGIALLVLIPVLLAPFALGLFLAAQTAVWEVYDHTDTYAGFVVAERTSDSKWGWTYYEKNPEPPPQHREAGKGTATGGPQHYVWVSSDGTQTGRVTLSEEDPDMGTWTNETLGTEGTVHRINE